METNILNFGIAKEFDRIGFGLEIGNYNVIVQDRKVLTGHEMQVQAAEMQQLLPSCPMTYGSECFI